VAEDLGVTNGIRIDHRSFTSTYMLVENDMVAYESDMWLRMHDVGPLRETRYGTYVVNWTYGTCMSVLDVCSWLRGSVPSLKLINGDVGLLRGWSMTSCLKA
jgi:hypothetical protein